ncbi:MAG TPA: hypothetical protein VEG68_19680 [Terriglobales bacterium]|nr:hypothetical protein [Terriglobales bacterium]
MNRKVVTRIIPGLVALFAALSAGRPAQAQEAKTPYPSMASVEQYFMPDRNAEIALARSAAPKAISSQAEILVLGQHGYETASQGTNGWVCMVERGWTYPDHSFREFWNPKIRGPECLNPPAARSILPITRKTAELALAGRSRAEIIAGVEDAYARKEMPALEPGAMGYMLSKDAYLTDTSDHNGPHLMFYLPHKDPAPWGANVADSPVLRGAEIKGAQPIDILMIPVDEWSDGTMAPPAGIFK